MIYSVDVEITAPVTKTEVTDRVVDAITNLFPDADVTEHPGEVIATTHQLEHLSERLHEQAILDTARGQFHANQRGDTVTFALKKQAAFQGVVNFSVGNPDELGDIHVQVGVTDPTVDELIDHLAPPTEDGTPLQRRDDDSQ